MKWTLYVLVEEALKDYAAREAGVELGEWITKWPGQVVILAMQILHNDSMERCFIKRDGLGQVEEAEVTLEGIRAGVVRHLEIAAELVKGELECNARISICNFMVSRIQARDSLC